MVLFPTESVPIFRASIFKEKLSTGLKYIRDFHPQGVVNNAMQPWSRKLKQESPKLAVQYNWSETSVNFEQNEVHLHGAETDNAKCKQKSLQQGRSTLKFHDELQNHQYKYQWSKNYVVRANILISTQRYRFAWSRIPRNGINLRVVVNRKTIIRTSFVRIDSVAL